MATDKSEELRKKKNAQRDALKAGRDKVVNERAKSGSESKSLADIAKALGVRDKDLQQNNAKVDIKLLADSLKSSESKAASSKVTELFDKTANGTRKDRSEAKKQSKLLKKLAENLNDPEEKEAVQGQIKKLDELIDSNKLFAKSISSSLSKFATPLAAISAGLLSDSPIVAAGAAIGVSFLKDKLEKRKARKEEFKRIALESANDADEKMFEAERDKRLEASDIAAQESAETTAERMNTASDNMESAVNTFAEKVNKDDSDDNGLLAEKVDKDAEPIIISNGPSDENQKEQILRDKENAELTGEVIAQNIKSGGKEKESKSGFLSMFGKGGLLGKLKKGLFGLLGAGTLGKFFGGIGGMFKGFGGKILKFIKKLPIIGLFLAGKGVFDSINDLPDDATILDKVFAGIRGAADGVMDFFLGIPVKIIDWLFDTDIEGFLDDGGGAVQVIADGIRKISSFITDAIESMIGNIKAFVEKTIRSIPFVGESLADKIFGKPNSEKTELEIKESKKENERLLAEERPSGFFETGLDFIKDVSPFLDSRAERDTKILEDQSSLNGFARNKQALRRDAQIKVTSDSVPVNNSQSNVTQLNANKSTVNTVNQTVASVRPAINNNKGPMLDRIQA